MTIDEAIREHKTVAREQRKRASDPYEFYPNLCRKRAEEHEQYIEWLEELKFLRTTKETMYREIYNKALEDFRERINDFLHDSTDFADFVVTDGAIDWVIDILKEY